MSMMKKGINYILVIIDSTDPLELPQYVCDTLPQCAEWLGCDVRILYNEKRYGKYEILLVKDVDDEI